MTPTAVWRHCCRHRRRRLGYCIQNIRGSIRLARMKTGCIGFRRGVPVSDVRASGQVNKQCGSSSSHGETIAGSRQRRRIELPLQGSVVLLGGLGFRRDRLGALAGSQIGESGNMVRNCEKHILPEASVLAKQGIRADHRTGVERARTKNTLSQSHPTMGTQATKSILPARYSRHSPQT